MSLTKVRLHNFTAFRDLTIEWGPGINVLVGENATGKTHILKVLYAACDITKSKKHFAEKLVRVFLPSKDIVGRLVHRQRGSSQCRVEVARNANDVQISISAAFSSHTKSHVGVTVKGAQKWYAHPVESVYIPVKEMLANAPGFRSLYAQREVHFEEVYADVVDRAYLPLLKGPVDQERRKLLAELQRIMEGRIKVEEEEFFLQSKQGKLEFSLVAEGVRKLGLLWLLIQNGTLLKGSILFWDEPEANLNPRLIGPLMEILLQLQRMGVQIFLATHDYVVLKELDLRRQENDDLRFHALYYDDHGNVRCSSTDVYDRIHPNAILDTFGSLYEREIERTLSGR